MSEAAIALELGSVLAGKYRVDKILGQGGMGTVFLAENLDIGRKVALKMLHPRLASDEGLVARFRQEARAAAAIGHPGIVDVLDLGSAADGGLFIVMEWLDGESAGERLERLGRLPVRQAVDTCAAALDALAAAHARGVVHRDLKPDNVFLVERPVPEVKLLDFGISKLNGTGDVSLTRTGEVMGTPLYMSPEQARGVRDVGAATDLWSMGGILFDMLTGRPPFVGTSYNEVIAKVITEDVPALAPLRPGLPSSLVALVNQLLRKDPSQRPNAEAARDALRAISRALASDVAALDATLEPALAPPASRWADALAATGAATSPPAVTLSGVSDTVPPDAPAAAGRRSATLIVAGAGIVAAAAVAVLLMRGGGGDGAGAPRDAMPAGEGIVIDAAAMPDAVAEAADAVISAPPVDAGTVHVAPIVDAGSRRPPHRPDSGPPQATPDAGRGGLGIEEDNPLRPK